ncbi:TetR/AcrR family transcriptional regulator [Herbaspirillum robiniae]|uniref:TetR/AcrR family transcriptional regulator n=1 Tax=Herbaspirillum robiniae TaxID=2014887 RepID=UPI003D76ACDF
MLDGTFNESMKNEKKKSPADVVAPSTRDQILEAATHFFATEGYANVSMRSLAADVGINPATLYHHFKDKQALYTEIMQSVYKQFAETFEMELKADQPPEVKIALYVRAFCSFASKNITYVKLIKRCQLEKDSSALNLFADDASRRQINTCQSIMRRLRPDLDPYFATMALHGIVLHHYESMESARGKHGWKKAQEDPGKLADFVLQVLLPST